MPTCLKPRPSRFQSTRPVRGETDAITRVIPLEDSEISIHSPREGRDVEQQYALYKELISIHSPREGRDVHILPRQPASIISIHSPREGRDA